MNTGMLEDEDLGDALSGFERVVEMEGDAKGEWGFKALKQIVKLHFKMGNAKKMIEAYSKMLDYSK